jgi:hypothetical protein
MPTGSYRRITNHQILEKNSAKFCTTRDLKWLIVNAEQMNTTIALLAASKVTVKQITLCLKYNNGGGGGGVFFQIRNAPEPASYGLTPSKS